MENQLRNCALINQAWFKEPISINEGVIFPLPTASLHLVGFKTPIMSCNHMCCEIHL